MYSLFKFFFRLGDYYRGLKLFLLINLCGGICKGIPKVGKNVVFKYPPHKGIKFGKKCDIGAFSHFDIPPFGQLIVGDCVKMTQGVVVSAINKVEIQSNTLIAEWVSIRDAQHLFDKNEPINRQGMKKGEILIEEDVWIGRGSSIFLNTTIRKGSIIGAESIVKSIEISSMEIHAGNPLKFIKNR